MTYGVDQCRRCGVELRVRRPEQMIEYLDSLKGKPTMPEAEWRRKGFLAMPTKSQMFHPQNGCCQPCGQMLVNQKMGAFRRLGVVAGFAIVGILIMYEAAHFITH